MAKTAATVLSPVVSATLAPPPVGTRVPADMTLEQWAALLHSSATKLPKCTIALPCGTPGVNDERAYTRAAPVNCPTCNWWLPVGTITTQIKSFRAYWHVSQLGDLKSRITQTIPEGIVPFGARADVADYWRRVSKESFDDEATRIPSVGEAPFGKMMNGVPKNGLSVSLNRFMEARRNFVFAYLDQRIPIEPTEAELTQEGGTGDFRRRGGFLLDKRALEGELPLKRVSLWACAEWCAGCVNPEQYPGGTPTCVTSIRIESENFDWGIFVKRQPGEYVVSISRLPKSTWDKIEDGIRSVTDQLDSFVGWMCRTYNSPTGQVASSAGQNSSDPQTQLATRAFNQIMQSCPGAPPVTTQTTYDPANPPKPPSVKSQTASNYDQLLPQTAATLSPPKSSVNMRVVFGLGALGLSAAGGAALIRKRKRKS